MSVILLILSFVLISGPALAKNQVLHFEPEIIQLSGIVERQTFPGRPGYESIKNGDEIERGWYLRLTSSVDVEVSKNDSDPNSMTERNVKILHLTWDSKKIDAVIPKSVGDKVLLKGHLFHALTAHHHARVLMHVDEVMVDDK